MIAKEEKEKERCGNEDKNEEKIERSLVNTFFLLSF